MALIYALAGYLIGQMDCMDSAYSCGIREFLIWQFVLVFFYASVAQYLKHLTDKSVTQVNRLAAFMVVMFCCWLPCVLSFCWDGMEEYLNLLTPWYLLFADFNGYLCIGLLVVSALLVLPLIAREVGAVYNAQETEK